MSARLKLKNAIARDTFTKGGRQMKLIWSLSKYFFVLAGVPVVQFDGYRTPFNVYRRVFPFVYKYLGTCWLAHWDKPEDIEEWIKEMESE